MSVEPNTPNPTAITGVQGPMKIEPVTGNASGGTSQTIGILITSDSPILSRAR